MRHTYYVMKDGKPAPATADQWSRWFEMDPDERILRRDQIGEVLISTVFLGIDHNLIGEGPPVLWESMIFEGPLDGEQHRYSSEEDAIKGHEDLVALVRQCTQHKEEKG